MEFYLVAEEKEMTPGKAVIPVWPSCCVGMRLCCREGHFQGGWLLLSPGVCMGDRELIARDLLRTCLKNGHGGVVLDFPPESPQYRELASAILRLARQYGLITVVPYGYPEGDLFCVPTATVSGNFREKMEDVVRQCGADRILLDLERARRDYLFPCPKGDGHPLSFETLRQLTQGCTCYFSRELAQRYFTYHRGAENHFVIFDDLDTLLYKIETTEKLGISKALVFYSEMRDLWPLAK